MIGIFEVMRNGEKSQNNFIGLVLPYLNNSSNWHVREELLNVLIICLLKSQSLYDFDSFQICNGIIRLLNDQKERIQLVAMEAIAAFAEIAEKQTVREIVIKIVSAEKLSPYFVDRIQSRLEMHLPPFINQQGALEFPYLDQLEQIGGPISINNQPSAALMK